MMTTRSRALFAVVSLLVASCAVATDVYVQSLGKGRRADRLVLAEDGQVFLEVTPRAGEGYASLSERVTGDAAHWRDIHRVNGGSTTIYTTRHYRVPLTLLPPDRRASYLSKLWPGDRAHRGDWVHKVTNEKRFGRSESLWHVARVFSGDGQNWRQIRTHNGLKGTALRVGQEVRIPASLLRTEYRAAGDLRAAGGPRQGGEDGEEDETTAIENVPYSIPHAYVDGELEFAQDGDGPYAQYRLGAGEALYSAVVIRFTGRIDADEVNKTALEIARRSGISDVRDIPVGYPVKIPLDMLTPDFLPTDHPRRIAWEKARDEGESYASARSHTRNLRGVTVVLDAGHGGIDVGASNHVVWEDDYVYDILCRVKKLLDERTEATVVTTIRDKSQGYKPHDGRFSRHDRDEVILTTPNFQHTNSSLTAVGVHLRWYISSYHYRLALKNGVARDRVVFTSFHADSLHPSVRGTMIYVPGRDYRPTRYGKAGNLYTRYKEVRSKPTVKFSRGDLSRSEGLSRALASSIVSTLRDRKVAVHKYKPVRNHVVRGGRAWVPAVLRYNETPTSLLVEVCNLNNAQDQKLLRDPAFRQRFAEAYVESLIRHFEQ